jgi:hypothetical protein
MNYRMTNILGSIFLLYTSIIGQQLVSNISLAKQKSLDVLSAHPLYNEEAKISPKDITATINQPKLGKFLPITGNLDQLKYFFNELKKSKNKKVRIAHYGDSLLLGDIITESLRERFQENYSGKGIGFASIIADDNRMRKTLIQSYSNDWNYASFVTRNPDQLPYGINGTVAVPNPGSWVKYVTTQVYRYTSSFDIVKIYYSNADKSSLIQYSMDNNPSKKMNLDGGDGVLEISIDTKGAKEFELQFLNGKRPYFYGVSLESATGVYVDNFPMRGNSGASLAEILPKTFQDFNKYLDYDLIIFNFGANVSSPNKGIYSVYENKMIGVIEEFKKAFPKTSFLLVSVADKTVKRGSQFLTNPDVPLLLESQKRIAELTHIAFWNLWEAMGGNNSMKDWVDAAPPQALKDYSHFTSEGGERVGELLYNALMDASRKF